MSQLLNIDKCTITVDENSWGWKIDAHFSDLPTWGVLRNSGGKGDEIKITIRGQFFHFLVDGLEKSSVIGKTTFKVIGRSLTVKLTKPYAQQITKDYPATTAKQVAEDLCAVAGVGLSWQTVNWPLTDELLSVKDKYPIEIINILAKAVGAVTQSSQDGATLIVRPRFPTSPTQYHTITPAHVLQELGQVASFTEKFEHRPGYDCIEISNQDTGNKVVYTIIAEELGRLLKITSVPFQPFVLLHSALGNISFIYRGVFTKEVEEDIEIVEGSGRLSQPYYGTVSFAWLYVDLGALTIQESGDVTTAVAEQSILSIKYITKWVEYNVDPLPNVEKAQVYINEG